MTGELPGTRTNLGLLVAGALATFFVGLAVAYGVPLADPALSTVTQHSAAYSPSALRGKTVYDREGCAFCHTQDVRPVSNDLGLGTVTEADRLARDDPPPNGLARIGPDLSCAGDRFESADTIARHVADPRAARPRSTMPRFDYLSEGQLRDLGEYLRGLQCGGKSG